LCLAVSRREGANCIAGIDVDSGKWIRPINAKNSGALWDFEIVVKDHKTNKLRTMAVLDLINLHLDEPVGNNAQPENWTLNSASTSEPSRVLCQAGDDPSLMMKVKDLAEASNSFSLIFGTSDDKVAHSAIEKEPVRHSLCVIRPKNLIWFRTTNVRNQPRIKGRFDFGKRNTRFCFPLTDIVWEPRLLDLMADGQILDASGAPGTGTDMEILLTISLGDLYKKTQCHYKLIAGVLLLPSTRA
jgi:hypothetical protein